MTDLLEVLMIVCFGLSWPMSIIKSYKSRTTKGKSLFFEFFIWVGYVFGISRKLILFLNSNTNGIKLDWLFYLGWVFYIINIVMISIDIGLYFRNLKIDRQIKK